MIIYSSTAQKFKQDVDENQISDRIEQAFQDRFGYLPGISERHAWNNSMQFMERVIRQSEIPSDCGILIEYNIPSTNKRIDFMITGQDAQRRDNFIVVELKQWEQAEATSLTDIVSTFTGRRTQDVTHPSFQAWSYMQFLTNMNETIQNGDFIGKACAYLHNYARKTPEPLLAPQYQDIAQSAPVFFKEDQVSLQNFLYSHVVNGNGINTMYLIENGRLRPSQKLMDHVAGLFAGNDEFILLDEQKVVFETILDRALHSTGKTVIMVKGGPGTGKSVISMNTFGRLLQHGKNIRFVAPNAAFRSVMLDQLSASHARNKAQISDLFEGSSCFWNTPMNAFDILVVDEAHRLKKRGAYMYKGQNQVDDVIRSSRVSILFIDDRQQIRPDDVGTTDEIRKYATQYQAELVEMELTAQFRCAGAEGFLNWIDDVLQIQETGNFSGWDQNAFEFDILDSPHDVYQIVCEKQASQMKARMLAGFAWDWTPKDTNPKGEVNDVVIPDYDFAMPWNQRQNSSMWAILPEGIHQIGCVHTSQGLEFDYVGLIIGMDLQYDELAGTIHADASSYKDKTGKKGISKKPEELTKLVKNIYRVLLSRGMKGCYVYVCNEELRVYMRSRLEIARSRMGVRYDVGVEEMNLVADGDT